MRGGEREKMMEGKSLNMLNCFLFDSNRFTFDAESNYVRSSKIAAVMGYIEGLRNTDDKCLVFT